LLCEYYLAAKEREKAQKLAAQKKAAEAQAASRVASRAISPTPISPKAAKTAKKTGTASGAAKPTGSGPSALEQRYIDVSALGLGVEERSPVQEEPPRMALARDKVLEEAAKALEAERKGQAGISLVVIGKPRTVSILSRGFLIRSRSCRCWKVDTYGKVALRAWSC
jgi:elongation factor 1 alpha-like protein